MSKIIDNIWLGGVVDVNNPGFYSQITHVINCTDREVKYKMLRAESVKLDLTDEEENFADVKTRILRGARYLNFWNTAAKDQMIMVHCMAGISRSPSIIIAYLTIYRGYHYDDAFAFVAKKHGFIRPNQLYENVLRSLQPSDAQLSMSRASSGEGLVTLVKSKRINLLDTISQI